MGKHVARRDTHVRVYANARQLSIFRVHCAIQPPIGFELMRILSPDVFVTVIGRLPSIRNMSMGRKTYRLYAAREITTSVPAGTRTSWISFPDVVRIGLESGRMSSWLAIRRV